MTTNSIGTEKFETTTNYTTADLIIIIPTYTKLTYARNLDLTAARILTTPITVVICTGCESEFSHPWLKVCNLYHPRQVLASCLQLLFKLHWLQIDTTFFYISIDKINRCIVYEQAMTGTFAPSPYIYHNFLWEYHFWSTPLWLTPTCVEQN